MLDNLYDEYAKLVEDVMTDHDRLLKEALDLFAQTGADVQDVIRATADEYGYEMTAEMEKIISSIEGMGSLDSYLGVGGTVTQSLSDIVNEVHNAYVGLSSDILGMKDAIASIGFQGKYDTSDVENTDNNVYTNTTGNTGGTNNTGSTSSSAGNDVNIDLDSLPAMDSVGLATKRFIEDLLKNGTNTYDPKTTSSLNKYIYGKYGSALTVEEMAKLSEYLGFNYTVKQLATENANHSKRKMKMLDKLKTYGFSKGGIVPDDTLKLEDAGLHSLPNGDTRLIGVQPKESVFNEKQTKMIQESVNKTPDLSTLMSMGNVMDKFIKAPDIKPTPRETSVKVEYDNVNINLPNVMNYEDFMTRAQGDSRFEKVINRMVDSHMGVGNPMKKYGVTFRKY